MAQPFRRLGQFFANTGQRAGDFLSDAFGVTAAGERGFQQGTLERSQTESAMALARQRQEAARREQAQRLQEERNLSLGQELLAYYAQPDATIEGAPLGATIVGGFGSDYASAALGQLRGQEQRMREQIADASLGDEARLSLMEALAPSAGVTQRLGGTSGTEAVEIAIDPSTGQSVFVPRSQAAGMMPGARPSATSDSGFTLSPGQARFSPAGDPIAALPEQPDERQRKIDSAYDQLVRSGIPEDAAFDMATNLADGNLRIEIVPQTGHARVIDEVNQVVQEVPLGMMDGVSIPQPSPDQTLFELAEHATGPISAAASALSVPSGLLGGPVAGETVQARQAIQIAVQEMIRSLAINPRFPVAEMNRLREEISLEPRVWDNPELMRQRMIAIDRGLRLRLAQAERDANDPRLPQNVRSDQAANASSIRNFLAQLGVPQQGAQPPAAGSSAGAGSWEGWSIEEVTD